MIAYFDTSALIPLLVEEPGSAIAGQLWDQADRVEVDDALVRRAGRLAQDHALRGYDAVHLAALERIADDQTVMVAGDDDLCAAAAALGVGDRSHVAAPSVAPGAGTPFGSPCHVRRTRTVRESGHHRHHENPVYVKPFLVGWFRAQRFVTLAVDGGRVEA